MSLWVVTVERTLVTDFRVEADSETLARIRADDLAAMTDTEDFDRLCDKVTWVASAEGES